MGEREVRAVTGVDVDALRGLHEAVVATIGECLPLRHGPASADVSCSNRLHTERLFGMHFSGDHELAALIVAAVNALPALLDELVALRAKLAESETMREANITYWQGVRDALVANNDRLREELASR